MVSLEAWCDFCSIKKQGILLYIDLWQGLLAGTAGRPFNTFSSRRLRMKGRMMALSATTEKALLCHPTSSKLIYSRAVGTQFPGRHELFSFFKGLVSEIKGSFQTVPAVAEQTREGHNLFTHTLGNRTEGRLDSILSSALAILYKVSEFLVVLFHSALDVYLKALNKLRIPLWITIERKKFSFRHLNPV